MGIGIYDLYHRWQPGFRARRRKLLNAWVKRTGTRSILDLGGNVYDWQELPEGVRVTVLNVAPNLAVEYDRERITYAQGDGRALAFADASFDLVYSNSVIEHLRVWEDQARFAREARRVGRSVFVQTPNRWFPVEPHFLAPFFHFLPKRFQRVFLPRFSLRALLRRGDDADLGQLFRELRLLSAGELQALFPECEIVRERLFGLTKSLIATGPPGRLAPAQGA
jgi:hypothetical protein